MRLVFGCGYLGRRVARRWQTAGDRVFAVTRSEARAAALAADGMEPIVADVTLPDTLERGLALLERTAIESVFYAVGYDRASGRSQHEVYVAGLANVLAALAATGVCVHCFVYISTTGVYGASGEAWIDETTLCEPATPGGAAHLAAERLLAASPFGQRSIVLRMAGLYGPGRLPRRDDLVAGRPIAAPHEGYLNLIHIDDAASVAIAAARAAPPRTFVVGDGQPTTRREYLAELARLVGAPPPAFDGSLGPHQSTRGTASKRVSNRRMIEELLVTLAYPNFREGLAASIDRSA